MLYPFILGRYVANEIFKEKSARTSRKKCPEIDSKSLFFLKVLHFSFPVPVVGPSEKDFYPLQVLSNHEPRNTAASKIGNGVISLL